MAEKKKTVLVCPLDWGLGHASRIIPLIKQLIRSGCKVILGGSGQSLELLKGEFPSLKYIPLPALNIRYSKGNILIFRLLWQLPAMISIIYKEHRQINKMRIIHEIDMIISDNRYGLFCKKIRTILITHQISPVLPCLFRWFEYPLYLIMKLLMAKFDECWIPDAEGYNYNLTGILSHRFKKPRNARYIGILSRFTDYRFEHPAGSDSKYDIVVVLSGPEPQKRILFELITNQLRQVSLKTLIICGLSDYGHDGCQPTEQITLVPHLPTERLYSILQNTDVIICRSGYSAIMDLVTIRKPAILIPTPGQTEQQYLAKYVSANGFFMSCKQADFRLSDAVNKFKGVSQVAFPFDALHLQSGNPNMNDPHIKKTTRTP